MKEGTRQISYIAHGTPLPLGWEEALDHRVILFLGGWLQDANHHYRASHEFLASHPEIVHESRESDGLLFEAYTLLLNGGHEARTLAQQYTHQALLLQYCHLLGRDGVSLFFKRMATPGHQAREAFEKDPAQTFQRIVDMAKRDAKKRRDSAETERMVERVQLCSLVDGEASARIVIPPAESDDEEVRKARAIFESFAPEMRAALETGSLDEVNKVLGEMETSEAEELASLLAEVSSSDSYEPAAKALLTSRYFARA